MRRMIRALRFETGAWSCSSRRALRAQQRKRGGGDVRVCVLVALDGDDQDGAAPGFADDVRHQLVHSHVRLVPYDERPPRAREARLLPRNLR